MKKIISILFVCATLFNASAKTMTSSQAMTLAENFIVSQSDISTKGSQPSFPSMQEAYRYVSPDSNNPLYYIFNLTDCAGYVIVSGDDAVPEVLGYSFQSSFDPSNIPPNMEWWLEQYANDIKIAAQSDYRYTTQNVNTRTQNNRTAISPLVKTTWDQSSPYNWLCPKVNNSPCLTGCVATMMAQIMKYYEWPLKGMGNNSYQWNGKTLSMDFSTVEFDWGNMPDGKPVTSVEALAVSTLMQACGYAVNMEYGLSESTAYDFAAFEAFLKHFQYRAKNLWRNDYEGDWEALIYNELANARPVCYRGENYKEGHAFICDGYDTTGYFHINWGWGGTYDGYFLLSNLNPNIDSGPYNSWQHIIYGITPTNVVKINNIWYNIDEEAAHVTIPLDDEEYHGDLLIPTSVFYQGQNYPIVSINPYAFNYCKNLTSLIIEAPVITEIPAYQFAYSSSLTKVKLPDSVTSIGSFAFYNCSSLKDFVFPSSLEKIESGAFESCGLEDVKLGDQLVELGPHAFCEAASLKSVTFGKSLKSIQHTTFYGCRELTTVIFENGLEEIGEYAFEDCQKLKEVNLPNSLTTIGQQAFYYLPLNYVRLGRNVKFIGSSAFYNTMGITRIDCYALEPPVCQNGAIHPLTELHVCSGLTNIYKASAVWCDINNIIDDLDSEQDGVDDILADPRTETHAVYSLHGSLIKKYATESEILMLPKGIYIYGGRKIIVK